MILPFWNSELQVEVSSWFPFGKDYQPVSVNRFHDSRLRNIAELCMDLDSEFYFMASPTVGCVGSLPRENFFRPQPDNSFNLGFLMTLGYSEKVEKAVIVSLAIMGEKSGLTAGITACTILNHGILEGTAKIIAVVSDDPFYDCTAYLNVLVPVLFDVRNLMGTPGQSYFAEKFGYDRFFMLWENDDPYGIAASRILSEMELDGTREAVGGSPREEFPPFIGATVSIKEGA